MKTKYSFPLFIICLLLSFTTIAQDKTANVWGFGWYAGLNFNVSPPVSFPYSSQAGEGS